MMGLEEFSQMNILLSDWKMCFVPTVLFWKSVTSLLFFHKGFLVLWELFYVVVVYLFKISKQTKSGRIIIKALEHQSNVLLLLVRSHLSYHSYALSLNYILISL